MKKYFILAFLVPLFGFGCVTQNSNPNVKTHKDTAGGYAFEYPTMNWAMKYEYADADAKNKVDDGITQAAFNNTSVILFHPVKDAKNAEDAAATIANLKYPDSRVIAQRGLARPELTEVTTKKGTIEYDWIVLPLPNHSSYLVLEITETIKQPYPEGLEAGVEMIINTVREL